MKKEHKFVLFLQHVSSLSYWGGYNLSFGSDTKIFFKKKLKTKINQLSVLNILSSLDGTFINSSFDSFNCNYQLKYQMS